MYATGFIYASLLALGVLAAVKRSRIGLLGYAIFCLVHVGYSFFLLLALSGAVNYGRLNTPFTGKSPLSHMVIELMDTPDTLKWYITANAAPFGYAAAVTFSNGHGDSALGWLIAQLPGNFV
ncbi:hypothetical protein BDF22DRAFT_653453 [Syncephalis plumigaleata]|nr:hypothetical protein BDF22DRAFT_653453 [Syncephalis plumigaleata]